MLSILKLDAGGIPQCWIDAEDATRHYADNSVLWTLGDPIAVMRGGMSRLTGRQSIIELHSIIAVKGSAKINLCACRISENDAEAEHIIPNSKGGSYTWMN